MSGNIFYRILEDPFVYNLSQAVLAPGAQKLLKKYFDHIFKESHGRILDVGCGPKLATTPVRSGAMTGLDINFEYVKSFSSLNHAGIVASADKIAFQNDCFDEVRCFGLLHHLPTETAMATVKEMIRCTRTSGRIIVIDNVWPKDPIARPLAWLNRKCDRGRFVRQEEELTRLTCEASGPNGKWESSRFTYTYIGHEALALILRKQ